MKREKKMKENHKGAAGWVGWIISTLKTKLKRKLFTHNQTKIRILKISEQILITCILPIWHLQKCTGQNVQMLWRKNPSLQMKRFPKKERNFQTSIIQKNHKKSIETLLKLISPPYPPTWDNKSLSNRRIQWLMLECVLQNQEFLCPFNPLPTTIAAIIIALVLELILFHSTT